MSTLRTIMLLNPPTKDPYKKPEEDKMVEFKGSFRDLWCGLHPVPQTPS
jgi:hypothetical protein